MPANGAEVISDLWSTGQLLCHAMTWNMHGKLGPSDLSSMLPSNKCHIYAIGTEECERTITQSMIFTSKEKWEAQVQAALGPQYIKVTSQTLQAIHLVVYIHTALRSVVNDLQQSFVPCGIGNALGNKGAVAISFNVGKTALLFINAHLAAHQTHVAARNKHYHRIERGLPLVPAGYGLEARLSLESTHRNLITPRSPPISSLTSERTLVSSPGAGPGTASRPHGPPHISDEESFSVRPDSKSKASTGRHAGESEASSESEEEDSDASPADATSGVAVPFPNLPSPFPSSLPVLGSPPPPATTATSTAGTGDGAPTSQHTRAGTTSAGTSSRASGTATTSVPFLVSERFDRVVFMGDLNYRVGAARSEVDEWIRSSSLHVRGATTPCYGCV